jgi:2-amino-4-hydroxy-6-hydroxymethyldihydropteridine diphosphokinase
MSGAADTPRLHHALISVGSNIEPERHIAAARAIVAAEHRLSDAARVIRTAPEGITAQPDFLNGAWLVATTLEQRAFNAYLKQVEDRLGRVRTGPKAGPRNIDLDLIVWDGRVVHRDYPGKSYVAGPIDELLRRNRIRLAAAVAAAES